MVHWKRQEQTQQLLELLRQSVSEIQEGWLNKAYVAEEAHKSDVLNTAALATARTLQEIIVTIESIEENDSNETQ
jgi:hypothetical protein